MEARTLTIAHDPRAVEVSQTDLAVATDVLLVNTRASQGHSGRRAFAAMSAIGAKRSWKLGLPISLREIHTMASRNTAHYHCIVSHVRNG